MSEIIEFTTMSEIIEILNIYIILSLKNCVHLILQTPP